MSWKNAAEIEEMLSGREIFLRLDEINQRLRERLKIIAFISILSNNHLFFWIGNKSAGFCAAYVDAFIVFGCL